MTLDNRIPPKARRDLRQFAGISLHELSAETGLPEDKLRAWELEDAKLLYSEVSKVIGELQRFTQMKFDELLVRYRRTLLTRPARRTRTRKVKNHGGSRHK
jgi:hypothetical protein